MTDLPNKPLFHPNEVADYFGVSRQTVYEWLRIKKLSHIHTPGGQIRIPKEAIKQLEGEKDLIRII